jgi:ribosomal protein S18 acetylase RimI-like enzyme
MTASSPSARAVPPLRITQYRSAEPPALRGAELLAQLRPALGVAGARHFLQEAMRRHYIIAVADDGNRDVGLAGYRILRTSRGRILMIEDLIVDRQARGAGVGTALLDKLKEWGRAHGCVRIELDTGLDNTAAQAFYHRYGLHTSALHLGADLRDSGD